MSWKPCKVIDTDELETLQSRGPSEKGDQHAFDNEHYNKKTAFSFFLGFKYISAEMFYSTELLFDQLCM